MECMKPSWSIGVVILVLSCLIQGHVHYGKYTYIGDNPEGHLIFLCIRMPWDIVDDTIRIVFKQAEAGKITTEQRNG